MFPLKTEDSNVKTLLDPTDDVADADELDHKWWKSAIVASLLDLILGFSVLALSMGEACNFQTEIELVIIMLAGEYKNDIPHFIKG